MSAEPPAPGRMTRRAIPRAAIPAWALPGLLLLVACGVPPSAPGKQTVAALAIERGVHWLEAQQGPDGAIAQPGTHLNPDVWETANALLALLMSGVPPADPVVARGFAFLEAHVTPEGGLPESSARREGYCVETTGVALLATEVAGRREAVDRWTAFLLDRQEPDGHWRIGYPELAAVAYGEEFAVFPSVTGFALAGLWKYVHRNQSAMTRGKAWLEARQTPEGDWGTLPDFFDTPFYATAQIAAAVAADDPVTAPMLAFTRARQNPDGSWGPPAAGSGAVPSPDLRTALALLTLLHGGAGSEDPAVDRGITYLLRRQQSDGRWHGGRFTTPLVPDREKREDVYTTALALRCLRQVLEK